MEKLVGAYYQANSCNFSVWAPHRNQVNIIINKARKIALAKDNKGYWEANAPDVSPGDLYAIELDGEITRPDPASISQPKGVHGQSQVLDRQYSHWTDDEWNGLSMNEMIIYELHVGTFTDVGTFEGIIDKLDYLLSLGINTIEIMPVSQFPGTRNWGYDGVFPFAVQDSYGGMDGLKKLVNHCHQKGIAFLLDVVYNHMGPEGNYLSEYGPYFTDKYSTPWGKAINFDDAYSDHIRSFFLQNALMWLDNFHLDGLRLDAVHAIKDFGAKHFLQELADEVEALERRLQRPLTLIGESDLNDPRYINPSDKGGYKLTGQWIDEFHHALHAIATTERDGYYSDFGEMHHLHKAFEKTFVYDGIYSPHRKKTFGSSAEENPFHQFVVFSQNHDQIGNRMMGDRLSQLVSYETLKLSAAAVLLSPYVPMLYMGEEYAEEKPFQYFVSHTDPELVEAVRKGRKSEFAYFQKEGLETPDPQSEQTFKNSTLSWNLEGEKHKMMLQFYQKLIGIRKQHPAMHVTERDFCDFILQDKLIIMHRRDDEGHLLIALMNFGSQETKYQLKNQPELYKLLDSSASKWLGPGEKPSSKKEGEGQLILNPNSVLVLSNITL
ncbi:maltooligosyltrehalose trehalohydrolase [Catalinimonas alkaloidigena]|uniref:malto-oligosyltrehalose trehalohydrolase n=1 Tax=Catalinimonas alkaloidigena TaxID=1075417 RepID=UPI002406F07A|nr:malto-oligosyltrehalose trehalohydrolase [Catalinimonas alkaloidigena]MDF9797214.1 maltooligosyltrehalose trehalohydrolase [Catalinimonas alkaloidigena]